jgi:small GTP-binding protein
MTSTLGMEFATHAISLPSKADEADAIVRAQIWDTAG